VERVLLIGLGGATGTVLRYLLTESDTSGGLLFAAAGNPPLTSLMPVACTVRNAGRSARCSMSL
jgi:hypothetical protein